MTTLSTQDFKRIIQRRDPRFDGRFYFGVKTTKIYCRPVCPARPKPENIIIFKSSTEAEKSGFRPCLRCRPDLAPGSKFFEGTGNTVSRALKIMEGEEDLSIEELAEKLGVTDRHLRRLFDEHLGASPVEIMIANRLHLAKQLILQTPEKMSEIAFASGFKSLRRFNEAFKKIYQCSPSEFRKMKPKSTSGFTLSLPLIVPYDFKQVLSYLKRHEAFGIEVVGNNEYRRYVPSGKSFGTIVAAPDKKNALLNIQINGLSLKEIRPALLKLRRLLDSEHNPNHLPKSKKLSPKGIRVPGSFDEFEVAVSIILSQLVSTEQAKLKLKQLIQKFGTKIGLAEAQEIWQFPTPERLSYAPIEEIGLPKVKSEANRLLSREILSGKIQLNTGAPVEEMRAKLLAIRGIGPWTVEMIAMRCLGDSDAFPENDLIIKRVMEKLKLENDWKTSRAYLTHCLWRDFGGKE